MDIYIHHLGYLSPNPRQKGTYCSNRNVDLWKQTIKTHQRILEVLNYDNLRDATYDLICTARVSVLKLS